MTPKCPICKKQYYELDPIGPEIVDKPSYLADCDCLYSKTDMGVNQLIKTMENKEFIQSIESIYAQGIEIIKKKNHDYTGGQDPYKNFRYSELLGISIERAILVRIMDKIARISNLLDKEAKVEDEKIEDTLIDAINYLAILLTYIKLERKK